MIEQRTPLGVDMRIDTFDIDFTHRFPWTANQEITWGLGYRLVSDDFSFQDPITLSLNPTSRTYHLYSTFIQDRITLVDDTLFAFVGSKFQKNDFTDFEYQPSGRMLWVMDERQVSWASVTRAVRTPSRYEHDFRFLVDVVDTMPVTTVEAIGHRGVVAEELMAYELGYRAQPSDWFSWDAAMFFNRYDNLVMFAPATPFFSDGRIVVPLLADNQMHGESHGFELTANYEIASNWRLQAWYSYLRLRLESDLPDPSALAAEGKSPRNQAFLMSSWDLPRDLQLDILTRYVDTLPAVQAGSYIAMDLRLGWQPSDQIEFSIVGQSLLQGQRREFVDPLNLTTSSGVDRGIYAQAVFKY